MRGSDQSRHLGTLFLWRGVYWVQNSTCCKKLLWILWIQGTWFCRCHCWSFPCILLQRGGEWVTNPFVQINVFSFWPYCYKSSVPNYQKQKLGDFGNLTTILLHTRWAGLSGSNPFVQINVFSFWPYCYKSSVPNYQKQKLGDFGNLTTILLHTRWAGLSGTWPHHSPQPFLGSDVATGLYVCSAFWSLSWYWSQWSYFFFFFWGGGRRSWYWSWFFVIN